MAIFRVPKHDDFTVMSNVHLRDERLSLKAKGLLAFMLAKPDGWNFTLVGLAAQSRDGIASIRSAVQELTEFGYLRRVQHHKPNGDFGEIEYDVIESPAYFAQQGSPLCENRTALAAPAPCGFTTAPDSTRCAGSRLWEMRLRETAC